MGFSFDVGLQRMRCKRLQGKALGPKIRTSEDPTIKGPTSKENPPYLLPYKLWSQGSSVPLKLSDPRMYGSSDQGLCLVVFYTASFGVPHRRKTPPLAALYVNWEHRHFLLAKSFAYLLVSWYWFDWLVKVKSIKALAMNKVPLQISLKRSNFSYIIFFFFFFCELWKSNHWISCFLCS